MHKKDNKNINYKELIPKSNHEIMFDLLGLNYIRTILVKKKSGFRNLRDRNSSNFITTKLAEIKDGSKIRKSRKETIINNINNTGFGTGIHKNEIDNINEIVQQEESSDDDNKKVEVVLSKEKILELQGQDYLYIKNFIFSLPFYGGEISLEKHRANREKYSAGKLSEPSIKVEVSKFIKKIEDKILSNPNLFKKLRQSSLKQNTPNELNIVENEFLNSPTSPKKENVKEDIAKDMTDVSAKLSRLFDNYSINLFAIVSFGLYGLIIVFSILEFVLTYRQMNEIERNLDFFNKGMNLTNIMLYTKYFLTEAVISNKLNSSEIYYVVQEGRTLEVFNSDIKKELEYYYQMFN